MDRFRDMQIFVRIVERRSFTNAADDLHIPRATVTNAMQRLEERLGTRLLDRTTRQVNPTLDGEAYYDRCLRLLADMEEAEASFRDSAPKGLLRVNLQGTLARHFVIPALPDFLNRYAALELSIGEGDRLVDLVQEGVDCVLRVGDLKDSTMVGRKIAEMQQVTCASPAYLARHGEPRSLDDLAGHLAVNYVSSGTGKPFPLEFSTHTGLRLVNLPGPVSVTGADIYAASAIAGLGLIQVPRYRIANELAEGSLRVVLPGSPPPPMIVSVLYPQNRQLSSRVRVFADWLTEIFARAPL
ncbi:LysR family transcriptional regulator [Phyllobacterium sp. UNC302MFCol5.2]|uniref:LysR family transcriptional regulator n=1 Tax=Phyllobacterium sp. UNC302MFCol5.2 TaxID=1449065 RepID=UPI0004822565|nr:LysR family transcriptional regulator [Phyllobacterium sp. UNC302MFCol5.2]